MADTKENILMTALKLFARDGYEAVSVSTIAGKLGMTKGALYKHYKNKQDIFDSIVSRMYEIDAQRAKENEVPQNSYKDNKDEYNKTSLESLIIFVKAQFLFWTEDSFASDFRKMLTLEQYRNNEMAELYKKCIIAGPIEYTEDLFKVMIERGILSNKNPKQLALEFYGPFYLLIGLSDCGYEKNTLVNMMNEHIEKFLKKVRIDN